jgi:hypothetical protein
MSPHDTIKSLLDGLFASAENQVTSWYLKAGLKMLNGLLDSLIPTVVADMQARGVSVTMTSRAPGTVVSAPPPPVL